MLTVTTVGGSGCPEDDPGRHQIAQRLDLDRARNGRPGADANAQACERTRNGQDSPKRDCNRAPAVVRHACPSAGDTGCALASPHRRGKSDHLPRRSAKCPVVCSASWRRCATRANEFIRLAKSRPYADPEGFRRRHARSIQERNFSGHSIGLKSDEFSFVFLRRLRFGDGRRPIAV
jgi:hypothetical protein